MAPQAADSAVGTFVHIVRRCRAMHRSAGQSILLGFGGGLQHCCFFSRVMMMLMVVVVAVLLHACMHAWM